MKTSKSSSRSNKKKINQSENNDETPENINIIINYKQNSGYYIYSIFHIIMIFIAVYLSWKCNNGNFDVITFVIALLFPHIYVIYILATKGKCDRI